jgi:SAM-dependent methyltransferase
LHRYRADFYRYLSSFALSSARRIVAILDGALEIRSVADFGCGEGAWLNAWKAAGAKVTGVDGPYVDRRRIWIAPTEFVAADLAQPIDLGRRFDLVQSLEVAEHLPADRAEAFIDALLAHGSLVLFSAAVPGQGGEHHVNEQPLEYWRAIFRKRGYVAVDYIRPLICSEGDIAWWYRYNVLLYVEKSCAAALPEVVRGCLVADGEKLRDYTPRRYRLRNALVRRLPASAVDRLARMKATLAARRALRLYPL